MSLSNPVYTCGSNEDTNHNKVTNNIEKIDRL